MYPSHNSPQFKVVEGGNAFQALIGPQNNSQFDALAHNSDAYVQFFMSQPFATNSLNYIRTKQQSIDQLRGIFIYFPYLLLYFL